MFTLSHRCQRSKGRVPSCRSQQSSHPSTGPCPARKEISCFTGNPLYTSLSNRHLSSKYSTSLKPTLASLLIYKSVEMTDIEGLKNIRLCIFFLIRIYAIESPRYLSQLRYSTPFRPRYTSVFDLCTLFFDWTLS